MSLIPLTCNQCGAPLEADASAQFLTCGHCHTRLQVVSSGSAHFTRVVEQLRDQTVTISAELRLLRLERELEELQKDWAVWCRKNEVDGIANSRDDELEHMPAGILVTGYLIAGVMLFMAYSIGWGFLLAVPVVVFLTHQAAKRETHLVGQVAQNRDRYRDELRTLHQKIRETRSQLPGPAA